MIKFIVWADTAVMGHYIRFIQPHEYLLFFQIFNSVRLVCALIEMQDGNDHRIRIVAVTCEDAISIETVCRTALGWFTEQGITFTPPVRLIGTTTEGHSPTVIDGLAGYGGYLIDLSQPEN